MHKLLLSAVSALALLGPAASAGPLATGFAHPPAETRPMVRWWWFGPNVEDKEIVREIHAMKAGGFGGFELATVYPLTLDGNASFLSDKHLNAIRLANETAHADGLRVDMTLGSGWPFGGPHIPVDLASATLKLVPVPAPAKSTSVDLPALKPGEHIVAGFVGTDMASASPIDIAGTQVAVKPAKTGRTLFAVLQTPTGQQVKRAAYGAEGNVLDHLNRAAIEAHLTAVGDKMMAAFGEHPPYAVFSDSLEVYGANWTPGLLAEFQNRRGYDLKPHLLDLFQPGSSAVRRDWGVTLVELTETNYLSPLTDWAHRHNTLFRSQTYGYPPVSLASNRLADLTEGEGANWRAFTTTRWATSSNHIYGHAVSSAESWTWLHAGAFQATPLDIKAEADVLMLEGVNQFIAHGWPYSPPSATEPGWAFYAAAVFNDHNPWWGAMPDVTGYLQRMSYLLRQGAPVADVAIFLPEDDVLADASPSEISVNVTMNRYVTDEMTAGILDAGYNFDYVDGRTVLDKGIGYKVLVLPRVHRMAPAVMARIEAFAEAGGVVIAIDNTPDSGPGLMNAAADGAAVRTISHRLFDGARNRVVGVADLGRALQGSTAPDLVGTNPALGFVHRRLEDGDLYFVANTSNQPVTSELKFRAAAAPAQWWDPRTGAAHVWHRGPVTLAPYESRLFVFGAEATAPVGSAGASGAARVLATGWSIAFGNEPKHLLKAFASWSDMPGRSFYSGTVTYSTRLSLTKAEIAHGLTTLDFGSGETVAPPRKQQYGTRALLTAPVRDAAEVYVNGKRAGAVWTAPFTVSLKGLVHPGDNRLEIRVANTAVNALASRPPTDYAALSAKFGERFQAQNMDHLKPLPSGLLNPPRLVAAP